jgi:NOL1/NOP2/fmu family ribosome biogenesis protein
MRQKIEPMKLIEGKEKKEILEILKKNFGVTKIPGKLFQRGKERIFIYSGNFEKEDIEKLSKATFIERIGVYFAKKIDDEIRLSIEGTQILKNEIKKNLIELTQEEMLTWMMGHELLKKTGKKGFVIMKYKENMLGTGKASEEKITNFIPKSRRLKDKKTEK